MAKSWSFFRAGGVDQVVLKTGSDIENLRDLDQKLWVALACPTKGTEIDEKTLDFIDTDDDERIRAPEVLDAVDWSKKVFKNLDVLFESGEAIQLSQINGSTDEGKAVLQSAKRILRDQGKKEAKEISMDDVGSMEKLFLATRFNGDGIVPADSADDEETKKAIEDVITAVGSITDRSGKPGVDQKLVDGFFEQATAVAAWDVEGAAEGVRPLGEGTAAAANALEAVEAKIADYFARTRVASFDARAAALLNPTETELTAIGAKVLSQSDADVGKLPIARVEANRPMPLETGINPAWAEPLSTFVKAAVTPLLGARATLSEADFQSIQSKLAAFRAWTAKKPSGDVTKLDHARIVELANGTMKVSIDALVTKDASLSAEYAEINSVEKAIRFRRDLVTFLKNFVNFADFYSRKGASFQAGTLYLDSRACDLTVYVNDPAKHVALASLSKAYLAYCDCTRVSGEKMGIVAAFTAGDVDNLMVGRNGVFYDRKGVDWDATITSVIENPISVRQAFWSPYKRLIRLIEEQVAKRAAEKEAESSAQMDAKATAAANADKAAAAPAAPAPVAAPVPEKKVDVGTVAAIGVAIGGIGTFLSMALATFLGLGMWIPLGILALLLAISGPSMLIAWLKLRQRNLGPILDANGWAINGQVKINVPFGGSLTNVAKLPEGASRTVDPFAEKPTPWVRYVILLLIVVAAVLWLTGKADGILPERVRSSTVFKKSPPAAPAAAPTAAPAK